MQSEIPGFPHLGFGRLRAKGFDVDRSEFGVEDGRRLPDDVAILTAVLADTVIDVDEDRVKAVGIAGLGGANSERARVAAAREGDPGGRASQALVIEKSKEPLDDP
jgi:hypothetical protein